MNDLIPRVGSIFAPLAMKVSAGIIAALGAALIFMWLRADSLSNARDNALRANGALEVQLDASNASVAALEGALARYVAEGTLRAEQAQQALERAENEGEAIREAARDTSRTDWRGQEGL